MNTLLTKPQIQNPDDQADFSVSVRDASMYVPPPNSLGPKTILAVEEREPTDVQYWLDKVRIIE